MNDKGILRVAIACVCAITLLAVLVPASAQAPQTNAVVLYVATNAVHMGPGCGARERPCRSISRAIRNAQDGNLIEVGPGIYGDIDGDGDATGVGEEAVVDIDKAVIVYSQAGATQTIIRGPRNPQLRTQIVRVFADNATLRGFTIVGDTSEFGEGSEGILVVGSGNVTIADNIVTDNTAGGIIIQVQAHSTTGEVLVQHNVATRNEGGFVVDEGNFPAGRVRLEQNIAADNTRFGFSLGSSAHEPRRGPGHVAVKNLATRNQIGFAIHGGGHTVTGNWAVANAEIGIDSRGPEVGDPALTVPPNELTGNVVIGNGIAGFRLTAASQDTVVQRNNIFGNGEAATGCGLINEVPASIDATDNYWGRSMGPSPNPGDRAHQDCMVRGTVRTSPFSPVPFPIEDPSSN